MANAGVYDLKINKGATFVVGLTLKKANGLLFDLTGYTGRCQIRKTHDSSEVIVSPSVAFDNNRKTGKIFFILSKTCRECNNMYTMWTKGFNDVGIIHCWDPSIKRIFDCKSK